MKHILMKHISLKRESSGRRIRRCPSFFRIARLVDKNGKVVIFKNNKPKYLIIDASKFADIDLTDDERIDLVAAQILKKYKAAFMELAK